MMFETEIAEIQYFSLFILLVMVDAFGIRHVQYMRIFIHWSRD